MERVADLANHIVDPIVAEPGRVEHLEHEVAEYPNVALLDPPATTARRLERGRAANDEAASLGKRHGKAVYQQL